MNLPDVITIGAMKCGTSSLHHYMDQHPAIGMSRPKELNFFVTEPNGTFHKGLEWYAGCFPAGDGLVRGESSTSYTKRPRHAGVAARIHATLPRVRLIYIVRDPIDRCVSHWMHLTANGRERRPFDEAVLDPSTPHYVDIGRYATQLDAYLACFPPEQVHVVDLHELHADPAGTMRGVFRFVGVDPEFTHPLFARARHVTARKGRANALGRLVGLAVGEQRLRAWRRRGKGRALLFAPVARPGAAPATRARLADTFAPEVARLRDITGKPFATWSV